MKTLFHGTTLDNYNKIIASNFGKKDSHSWYCSDDDYIYFYDVDKSEQGDDYKKEDCINMAFESAKITASVSNYLKNELVVLEIEVEDGAVKDDFSCENMSDTASCVDIDDLDILCIKKVHKAEEGYTPSLRLMYVHDLLINNNHINTYNFNEAEMNFVNGNSLDLCYEDLFYVEYETEIKEFESLAEAI